MEGALSAVALVGRPNLTSLLGNVGSLLAYVLAGLLAQLVDGSLGMGFGVSANTVLVSTGVAPAAASATVHVAKIGTAVSSGASHWRYGNVSWPLVLRLGLPGAVGAFAGANFLSSVDSAWVESAVAVVLCGLGIVVVLRATGVTSTTTRRRANRPTASGSSPAWGSAAASSTPSAVEDGGR